jgi:hypothetical protein
MCASKYSLWASAFLIPLLASAQSLHTPKPGSSERQAICDSVRARVVKEYATRPLPEPIVFHIDHISVQDGFCFFEGTPRLKSGGYIPSDYLPDMAYIFCLANQSGRWTVILDLSRSDVPSADEIRDIKQHLPPNFPGAVFSPTWRKLLGEN